MDYAQFVKQVEKDKNAGMEKAHLKYIDDQKAHQDREQDKYYKFYKDFNDRMENTLDKHQRYIAPIKQKEREAQMKAEADLEAHQRAEDMR